MKYDYVHDWPDTPKKAIEIQKELAPRVSLLPNSSEINLIAAVETTYSKNGDLLMAAANLFTFPEIEEVEKNFHYGEVTFPYIPGMFFYREGKIIIKVLEKFKHEPDLIIVHGHGIAHPQFFGMASHIGLGFNKPAIGCCRKILVGKYREPSERKGSHEPIYFKRKMVGYALRSKDNVKPIFVSPGHLCDCETAKDIILKNLRGFRLPEPLRIAHSDVSKYKRSIERKLGV